jgi:hypothetical protein
VLLTLGPLRAAEQSQVRFGVSTEHCLSALVSCELRREPNFAEQRRDTFDEKAANGVSFFFGYFLFGQANRK